MDKSGNSIANSNSLDMGTDRIDPTAESAPSLRIGAWKLRMRLLDHRIKAYRRNHHPNFGRAQVGSFRGWVVHRLQRPARFRHEVPPAVPWQADPSRH